MAKFLVRRLLWAVFLFFSVTIITFLLFYVVPGDPAALSAGKQATQADVARIHAYLHLDEPIWQQYGRWLWNLVAHGSFGRSFVNRRPVSEIVLTAAPVTAGLVFGGAILWMLIAIPVGVYSALKPRSIGDRAGMVFVLIGISAHPVWIGLIFSYFIGYKAGLTPITGYCDLFNPSEASGCGGPIDWVYHMILPWMTFAVLFAALYVRMIRATVMETLNEDYVRTARAKGVQSAAVLKSHVLRNSMLPVVTLLGMDIGLALGGAIFTESVFSLPGLGRTVVQAYDASDLPTISGIVVFSAICVIVFNIFVDLLYAFLDPRITLT